MHVLLQSVTTSAIFCTLLLLLLVHKATPQLQEVDPPQFGAPVSLDPKPQAPSVKTYQQLMKEMEPQLPTLQRSERRIQNMDEGSFYLPGLGVVKEFVPSQVRPTRSRTNTIHPQRFSRGDSSKVQSPSAISISPVSVTVSEQGPPPGPPRSGGSKCEYVQMKGDEHMLESNCMRGGMSCERNCEYDTSEPVCTETLTVSGSIVIFL